MKTFTILLFLSVVAMVPMAQANGTNQQETVFGESTLETDTSN